MIPTRRRTWQLTLPDDVWLSLLDQWKRLVGPFDEMAIYQRTEPDRPGLSVLLIANRKPLAFAKVGRDKTGNEATALELVEHHDATSFLAPRLLGSGSVDEWQFVVMEPVLSGFHRPAHQPPIEAITSEIRNALCDLPRPIGTPDHWTPMHGDFAPWNLRRRLDNRLVLIDWEHAGWGPPGADMILYEAAEVGLGRRASMTTTAPEAAAYWLSVRYAQPATASDQRRRHKLLAALTQSANDH